MFIYFIIYLKSKVPKIPIIIFALLCTLYYQRLFIITRRHRSSLRIEKTKYNATKSFFKLSH